MADGAAVTVYQSRFGELSMLGGIRRFRFFVDGQPGRDGDDHAGGHRYLQLDLATGQVSRIELPADDVVVGELNDVRVEVVRAPYDPDEPWRADLVLVQQQPRPDRRTSR